MRTSPRPSPEVGGVDVYYAGKAFLCSAVARWVAEEGLSLDVCSGGELAVAQRAGFPAERIGLHGNNKASPRSSRRSSTASAGSWSTRSRRSTGSPLSQRSLGVRAPGDGPGHRRGRGAHPRVHRHRPRGPEVRLLARGRARRRGRRADPGSLAGPRPAGPALPHRQPDLRHVGLRGLGPAPDRPARPGRREARGPPPGDGPRRRLRHRLHLRAHPAVAPELGEGSSPTSSGASSRASATAPPAHRSRGSRSSRGARSPARAPSRSTRSAPSRTSTSATA